MISRVLVVIPAADEQDDIGSCLQAVRLARARLDRRRGDPVVSRVVVVLDDCRDNTAAVVSRFDGVDAVVSSARCVGTARALGVKHALTLDPVGASERTWLASTDADSRVPRDWLLRMTEQADQGADLVVGTVRPSGLSLRVRRRWYAEHRLRDGHSHVHGANLGIRASSYAELGGWRDLATHEDVDLVDRATAHGRLHIRRSADLAVSTSSRRAGRAPHGFADYLHQLHQPTSHTRQEVSDTCPPSPARSPSPPHQTR